MRSCEYFLINFTLNITQANIDKLRLSYVYKSFAKNTSARQLVTPNQFATIRPLLKLNWLSSVPTRSQPQKRTRRQLLMLRWLLPRWYQWRQPSCLSEHQLRDWKHQALFPHHWWFNMWLPSASPRAQQSLMHSTSLTMEIEFSCFILLFIFLSGFLLSSSQLRNRLVFPRLFFANLTLILLKLIIQMSKFYSI